ncbi:antibiotic biosynthesis monooxygenase [Pseudomonas sp. ZM23]|uniref:Antibiotic biosynthesis monooxygenase n=1 Tax=Pseudomonas triclosanedens TaxID=2961893 RepID=A0ABY6ZS33_9PSED|nr:antibiotic biosynthesis monooxygenase [Pseudomonas triclosanedens]MCP8467087.1 antibiotic biosynthesis monooxygenase [Pseudomonas triclosanedens]MCP8472764.1 antibiotic biosynthesis monooxygenase [Pseudomonas triclosanedens]MCP8478195.1 antibiotic biosynthesis monooxygenase [Pseudomonas triclosanedens]WAI47601.1 antibiotic biosynthesis monooxygenase [Pseudomonas triclosanedens]
MNRLADQESVTLIIRHRAKPGSVAAYETILRELTRAASEFPGHLGVDVMRQGEHFTSVLRFASAAELQDWLDSPQRRTLIERAAPLLVDGDRHELHRDHEFWFAPQDNPRQPPRWKQAAVSYLVILPLVMLVPLLWHPLFVQVPWLGSYLPANMLITVTIVVLVVYVFMPRATRLFSAWLNAR